MVTRRSAELKIAGTWLAFVVAIVLALPQPPDLVRVALGAIIGIVIISAGFWAAWRCRPLNPKIPHQRLTRAIYSVLAGAALACVLLVTLVALAHVTPALRTRFTGRADEPAWRPWALAFESSIIEEVVFRLFILSLTAFIVSRLVKCGVAPFALAWIVSTLLFALAHLPQWLSLTAPSPALIASVVVLNGAGGLLFGWIFWRWGLPYAILCHAAGDVIIQTFAPKLLSLRS
jgi:hypothetical protein